MLRTACIFLCALATWQAQAVDIRLWHSMSGERGAEFERLVARFNAAQREFRVLTTYKGAYDEAVAEAVMGRRSARAPHLVQASEFGGAFLLEQKGMTRPLWQVLADAGVALGTPLGGDEIADAQRRLLALPLGRSTPVLYYNRDALRGAALDPAKSPATWDEVAELLGALVGAGSRCAFTAAWPPSMLLENMNAWHNLAFASEDDRLVFNNRMTVRWISTLATWQKAGYFTYAAQRDEAEARFAAGDCALLAASSASYPELRGRAKFDLGVAQFPYYDDFDGAPLNTLGAGASLWVMAGRGAADYAGVARFLAWFGSSRVQAEWHQRTGLVPLSTEAVELTRAQGFYNTHPSYEVAVRQLMAKGTPNWKSLRLGQHPELRSIIDEELDLAWQGRKPALDAINAALARGNALLDKQSAR